MFFTSYCIVQVYNGLADRCGIAQLAKKLNQVCFVCMYVCFCNCTKLLAHYWKLMILNYNNIILS